MDIQRVQNTNAPILRCISPVERVDDALTIISACFENEAVALLLDGEILPDAFFQLQTRFAGDFVQKLVNYRIKVAAVFGADRAYSQRFREYIAEARHGNQFRTFDDAASALRWLDT